MKLEVSEVREFFERAERTLPRAVRGKLRNRIASAAATAAVSAMRPYAPKRSGGLRKSLGRRKWTRWPVYIVGARLPEGAHAVLTSEGTAERRTRSGARRGRVQGSKWFDRAIAAAGPRIVAGMARKLAQLADKGFREVAKK